MRATQVMPRNIVKEGRVMQFNDMLAAQKITPSTTLVLRHRPMEPQLRKVLPWLAAKRPELYNAYQQCQSLDAEKMFMRAKHIASFVGIDAGTARFAGLYSVGGWSAISNEEYWQVPQNRELHDIYGMTGLSPDRTSVMWFDLKMLPFYEAWRGRLSVRWPGLELSWKRWADRNELLIDAISEKSTFEPELPKWDELVLSWLELKTLPQKWQPILQQWRGIYYIFDTSDGKGYVGSAYGADNLLGRWMVYAKSGHGGNKLLRGRDYKNFQFSILRLLNHDEDKDEVIRIETTWKNRLHTHYPNGLNDN
jgi:hypothetical protein